MTDRTALDAAIDEVYRAFAHHPLRSWTEPCTQCCTSVETEAKLHAHPLRELPVDVIAEYSYNAMTTWGDERELNHLLPRLLEVSTIVENDWICIEAFGTAMGRARPTWTSIEQDAVDRALLEFWRIDLDDPDHLYDPGDLLCAIGWVTDDLTPHLEHWGSSGGQVAARQLITFVRLEWDPERGHVVNGFWARGGEHTYPRWAQMEQIADWLTSPAPFEVLASLRGGPSEADADRALAALHGDPAAFR